MNLQNFKIRNASSWTMFVFGILALILGVAGLIRPEFLMSAMGFEALPRDARTVGDYTLVFVTAAAMASTNMGVYYVLAALNNLKPFYRWTVPFRILTFCVFTLAVVNGLAPVGFIGVAAWELVGALATGAALWREAQRGIE